MPQVIEARALPHMYDLRAEVIVYLFGRQRRGTVTARTYTYGGMRYTVHLDGGDVVSEVRADLLCPVQRPALRVIEARS